ncbi:MAG: hypothetical protein D4S02_04960 [Rhodocyclaceae bacterium]|nr:MAG: hypothetical protein D4S02_04960 [Rhodocyclaceae bacterium]
MTITLIPEHSLLQLPELARIAQLQTTNSSDLNLRHATRNSCQIELEGKLLLLQPGQGGSINLKDTTLAG